MNAMKAKRTTVFLWGSIALVLLLVLLTIGLFRFFTATDSSISQDFQLFRPYIAAYTSGSIPRAGHIEVAFAKPAIAYEQVGSSADKIIAFSPKIKGHAQWQDDHTLRFTPDGPLPSGMQYLATVRLDRVFDSVPDAAEKFKFSFRVIEQQVELARCYIFSDLQGDRIVNQARGSIFTADQASLEDIQSGLSITTDAGTAVAVHVEQTAGQGQYTFSSDPLPEKTATCQLLFNAKQIGAKQDVSLRLPIPDQSQFSALDCIPLDPSGQHLMLIFSQPLDPAQSLDGLIHADQINSLRTQIEGNTVSITLPNQLQGQLNLYAEAGIRSKTGRVMAAQCAFQPIMVGTFPEVAFLQSGNILPAAGKVLLPFRAQGLRAVDVFIYQVYSSNMLYSYQLQTGYASESLRRVGKLCCRKTIPLDDHALAGGAGVYALDLTDLVAATPGVTLQVGLSMRRELSTLSTEPLEQFMLNENNARTLGYGDPFADDYRSYDWELRNDPTSDSYYAFRGIEWKNLLVSNIGLIAKQGLDSSLRIYTTNLMRGKPVSGVDLTLYSYQLQPMARGTSDANGLVNFELKPNQQPFIVEAVSGSDHSYLVVDENGQELSYSSFEVGGSQGQNGLRGFFYGERDVWRPGDSIFLTLMLDSRHLHLPEGHPIQLTLFSPTNQVVDQKVVPANKTNVYTFRTATAPGDRTGYYQVEAQVGTARIAHPVRVETIKPNRLKIALSFQDSILTTQRKNQAFLRASWLHGGAARNLQTRIEVALAAIEMPFPAFSDYSFSEDQHQGFMPMEQVHTGELNGQGVENLAMRLPDPPKGGAMFHANFLVRVFESGGSYSIVTQQAKVSPYEGYVGIKAPKSDQYYLETDKDQDFEFIALNEAGHPMDDQRLEVTVYKLEWGWWWEHNSRTLADYLASQAAKVALPPQIIKTNAQGRANLPISLQYPAWGRYLVRAVDMRTGHACSRVVYWDWPASLPRPADRMASQSTVLPLTANKATYSVGETVQINVPTPPGAMLLVSIEDGYSVLESYWQPTEADNTKVSFKATASMSPNAYANISLIQPYEQSINDMPLRLYGVIPVMVENPNSRLQPVIGLPEEVRPGSTFEIKLSEQKGRAMTATIALVDQGLLDVTAFKTPDPWKYFYKKIALGPRTYDLYDQIIGAYGGRLSGVLSVGGDMAFAESAKRETDPLANRFVPLVRFFGPYDLLRGEKKTLKVTMPDYVGAVRVMVVVAAEDAYGSVERTLAVRQPLMVQPTLPRQLATEENFLLPVTVFSMKDNLGPVELKVEAQGAMQPQGTTHFSLHMAKAGDTTLLVPMRTASKAGVATVSVSAKAKGEKAESAMKINVVNTAPYTTTIADQVLGDRTSTTFRLPRYAPGSQASAELQLSTAPTLPYRRLLDQMLHYPHRCGEQVASIGMVTLAYLKLVKPPKDLAARLQDVVKEQIGRLAQYQMAGGGFTTWPGSHNTDEWVTNHVGHFLLLAKEAGFSVPAGMLSDWLRYQRGRANTWKPKADGASNPAVQAYRLYTMALDGKANLSAMNRLLEYPNRSLGATFQLAAAYLLAGNKQAVAKLMDNLQCPTDSAAAPCYWYESQLVLQAQRVNFETLRGDKEKAYRAMSDLAARLSKASWIGTQEAGLAMAAALRFNTQMPTQNAPLQAKIQYANHEQKVDVSSSLTTLPIELDKFATSTKPCEVKVSSLQATPIYAALIVRGQQLNTISTSFAQNLAINVEYQTLEGNSLSPWSLPQGTDFLIKVTVRDPNYSNALSNLVLHLQAPSGWELRNPNLEGDLGLPNPEYTYQEYRDQEVFTYFDLAGRTMAAFSFMVNASYQGRFTLQPITCEAMYDGSISARTAGATVEVTR